MLSILLILLNNITDRTELFYVKNIKVAKPLYFVKTNLLLRQHVNLNRVGEKTLLNQQYSQSGCSLGLHFSGHFCFIMSFASTTEATKLFGSLSSLSVGKGRVRGKVPQVYES